jgi:hypothetical protein
MKIVKLLFIYVAIFLTFNLYAKSPFLIYYGDNASISYINSFKTVVLDPDHYNYVFGLKPFKYGYISIGEVENYREYYEIIKNLGIFTGENKNWKGSYYISLKSGKWQDFVINFLIPSVLAKGYNGIFLDTVDSLIFTHKKKSLIIEFINSIKRSFPHIKLMMNRGFEIADKVNVDAILFESTVTTYDFKLKKYYFLKDYKSPELNFKNKKIKKFSVDYWYLNDIETVKKIYKKALKIGYKPFVSDITLQKIPGVRYDEDSKNFILINFNK